MEMGYGRVNAEKAVSDSPVGIEDDPINETKTQFAVTSFVTNVLDIRYLVEDDNRSYEMAIIDMSGKQLLNAILPAGYGIMNLDVSSLTPGMYFVKCINGIELIASEKFVKVR